MFSNKLLVLVGMATFIVCITGLKCDGTMKSEMITGTPLKSIQLLPGNQVNLVWTWCVAINSSVTGIIIYRSSQRNQKRMDFVLTMDLSKNVYYRKDKSRHELSSILNKTKFQEKTVFIIHNVSKADSGAYSLLVRREGGRDLQSELVNVIVKTNDPTKDPSLTMETSEGPKTELINKTVLQTKQPKKENVDMHFPTYTIIIIVFSMLSVVVLVVCVTRFIRRKKSKNSEQLIPKNYDSGSGTPIVESSLEVA